MVADSSDSEVSAPITRSRIRLEETRKDREAARRLKSFVQAEQHPSITDANTHDTKPRFVTAKGFRLTIEKASCIKSVEESSSSASSDEESQPSRSFSIFSGFFESYSGAGNRSGSFTVRAIRHHPLQSSPPPLPWGVVFTLTASARHRAGRFSGLWLYSVTWSQHSTRENSFHS